MIYFMLLNICFTSCTSLWHWSSTDSSSAYKVFQRMYQQCTCIKPDIPWSVTAWCWQTAIYWSSGFPAQTLLLSSLCTIRCSDSAFVNSRDRSLSSGQLCDDSLCSLKNNVHFNVECKLNHNMHLRVYSHLTKKKRIRWKDYPRERKRIQRELIGKP